MGTLTFPIIADGRYNGYTGSCLGKDPGSEDCYKITRQLWEFWRYDPVNGFDEYCYPTTMIMGPDFIMYYNKCGFGFEGEQRALVESLLCTMMPPGTTFGNGNSCP